MPGPPPKDAGRRQRRNARPEFGLVTPIRPAAGELEAPAGDKEWLVVTRDEWLDLWGDPVAKTYNRTSDLPALRRLFGLRDERERYRRLVRKQPLVEGSQGQMVLNPLGRQIGPLDAEIRQLEDRFGLNPQSRLKLGIKLGEAARSLDDLTRGMYDDEDPQGDEEGVDPRLGTVEARSRSTKA